MNKTLTISVIALVAVVMGLSAISPMIQYAEASHAGDRDISGKACEGLRNNPNPSPAVEKLIEDHCDVPPPGN